MGKVVLFILFTLGVIHSVGFAQSARNAEPLRFKTGEDVLILYFRVNKSDIDLTYMNNGAVVEKINRIVTEQNIGYIDSLVITAYASPEASSVYNKRLSERRANAVRDYFIKLFPILGSDLIHAYGHGENWEGLRLLAADDAQLPMQDEVLRIIDSNIAEDERELKLKALQGGAVYRYIFNNFYPRLRLGASLNVMLAETAPEELQSLIDGRAIPLLPAALALLPTTLPPIEIKAVAIEEVIDTCYPLAFRTNMTYDLMGALNIGLELPYGKKKNWSVIADVAYSYWRGSKNRYAFQTLEYGLENRYWFGVKEERRQSKPKWNQPLKGFYVGAYGNYWQRYDAQYVDGYQGDASWSAGLTAGYAVPLSRYFSFDIGIGAGWFSTSEYRHYHQPEFDQQGKPHLMWQQTGTWGGLTLTKFRFALVWMIQTSKSQKRRDNL